MSTKIWLRDETKENEKRTPLTPENARKLIEAGHSITVEKSNDRIFSDHEYEQVGCTLVKANTWIDDAPHDAYILGLKELSEEDFPLKGNHIYFAHIFKGQSGSAEVFKRYNDGGGKLFDLEFLQNEDGKRIAAFGYWAGYAGAALAVEAYAHQVKGLEAPKLRFYDSKAEWVNILKEKISDIKIPTSIIIGAKGRCGTGAQDLLKEVGCSPTLWDYEETQKGGPFKEILEHDIFINAVLMTTKIPPFINNQSIKENKELSVIGDVSCDPNSDLNPVAIYNQHTTWEQTTLEIKESPRPLSVIAVDNLPSSLPRESSIDFSNQLYPFLLNLCNKGEETYTWKNARDIFEQKKAAITTA